MPYYYCRYGVVLLILCCMVGEERLESDGVVLILATNGGSTGATHRRRGLTNAANANRGEELHYANKLTEY
jgi:hypothetical protein